jgi:hypothetical protein
MAECFAGTLSYGVTTGAFPFSSSFKPATTTFHRSLSEGVRSLEVRELRRGGGESGVMSGGDVGGMTLRKALGPKDTVPAGLFAVEEEEVDGMPLIPGDI